MKKKEIDALIKNVNPRAKVPRGFGFWSETLVIMWLRAHQKKPKPKKPCCTDCNNGLTCKCSCHYVA